MARDQVRQLQAAQDVALSSSISFELPTTAPLAEIYLALEYAASTGVGGALTTPFPRAPWTLVKRIELLADGRDTIKSYDGGTLVDINHWDYGQFPASQVADLVASEANGSTTFPLHSVLVINLKSKGMVAELNKDGKMVGGENLTLLDVRKFDNLELKVTFGAGLADVFSTVAVATLDRFRLTPIGHEILDLDEDTSFATNQEVMTSQAFPTNTATERQFKLNTGNPYRRMLISTVDSNARATVDRLQKIKLKENGTFDRRVIDAGALKSLMSLQRNMAEGTDPANPATLTRGMVEFFRDATTPLITAGRYAVGRHGMYMIDIAEDGKVGSLLDSRGFQDLSFFLDYDGANTTDLIRITPTVILPNVR